jgi:quercetin dioxygenase-like cupin family protein
MRVSKLADMVRGWFVGNFSPSAYKTNDVEVGVRHYRSGDQEARHYHKIATELTVVISGRVRMNGQEYGPGDIVQIEPGEVTDFAAITDATNVVVKIPGVNNDKYLED